MEETRAPSSFETVRFQRAALHAFHLWMQIFYGLSIAMFCLLFSLISHAFSLSSIWIAFFCFNAAALLIYVTSCWSAYRLANWRRAGIGGETIAPPRFARFLVDLLTSPWRVPPATVVPAGEQPKARFATISGIFSSSVIWFLVALLMLACLIIWVGLNRSAPPALIGTIGYLFGGLGLALAYFYLVTEREFANAAANRNWPEAASLSQLARLVIVTLVVSASAVFLAVREHSLAGTLFNALGYFQLLLGCELLLRAGLSFFRPQAHDREPFFLGKSLAADLLCWPPKPLVGIQSQLLDGFGIDLQQIWAFSFIRRAAPVVLLGGALFGWLFSGLTEIPLTQRGIYERFGQPQAVLQPGLHIGLPWPFGRVIPIENGTVHEIATSALVDPSSMPSDAEGPAPQSANRLWDGTHVSEKSQIIASRSRDRESFQLVNMDVRFVYRVGLSDKAAFQSAYQVADVGGLIESIANRILVHDFATRTLDDVLSGKRLELSQTISAKVQGEMDSLNSGVEILAVVVEAIHPPAGAADAYHSVQAGQIAAEGLVSLERGAAAAQIAEAQENATTARDSASASAREGVAKAQVTQAQFNAEKSAYQFAGRAFLTEEYFRQLTAGMGHSSALIIDHRVGGAFPPTLDLRDPQTKPPASEITGEAYPPYQNEDHDP